MAQSNSKYLVEYYHEGAFWGIIIDAQSFDDAEARVRQLQYAKLLGRVGAEIPVRLGCLLAYGFGWQRPVGQFCFDVALIADCNGDGGTGKRYGQEA
jgi:hypothetical protein